MKKYILILLVFIGLISACDNTAAQDKYIVGPQYLTLMGATADTLGASDTLDYVIRLQGSNRHYIEMQQDLTKVSGTVTNNLFIQESMDNILYNDVDTIANSNESTGSTAKILAKPIVKPYVRLRWISPATAQKASYSVEWINRY